MELDMLQNRSSRFSVMTPRNYVLFSVCILSLTGCNKLIPLPLGNSPTAHNSVVPANAVVLAMGQSNMAGKTPGMNPAEGFTKTTGIKTINCAVGGTSIGQWNIGGQFDTACASAVRGYKVIGILWYQGEADAYLGTTDWDQSFTAISRGWRMRYGNVPIIYAQLATFDPALYPGPSWDLIKLQQASLGIFNSGMVRTDDLPRQDEVHLTGQADEEVGVRMAAVYFGLTK